MYSSGTRNDANNNSNAIYMVQPLSAPYVPTQTTQTLTPTTLKSLQESLERQGAIPAPIEHQHQAGFLPPVVHINHHHQNHLQQHNNNHVKHSYGIAMASDDSTSIFSDDSSSQMHYSGHNLEGEGSTSQSNDSQANEFCDSFGSNNGTGRKNKKTPKSRGTTGRKPRDNDKLTPEEDARRKLRRERNKLAAARCRKRRMDHTNELTKQTDGLESERACLQNELHELQKQQQDLEYILETHSNNCKIKNVSNFEKNSNLLYGHNVASCHSSQPNKTSRSRPNTLQLSSMYSNGTNNNQVNNVSVSSNQESSLVPIQTPSAGMFSLDGLMEGGTGLTPMLSTPQNVSTNPSSCGGQQQISSPDSGRPNLVSL